jgi:hypothetical protein
MADFPRAKFTDYRNLEEKPKFIEAVFAVEDSVAAQLSKLTGFPAEMFSEVMLRKDLGGKLYVNFIALSPCVRFLRVKSLRS